MKTKFPESKIICIEPDPENFKLLERNTNKLTKICLENSGLWVRSSYLKITDKFDFGNWGMVTEETSVPGNLMGVSVSDIINKHKIDYVDIFKIDIESSEKILFSENYQEWLPKVKMIIIELHDNLTMGCGKVFFNAIHNTFQNYSYFVVGDNTVIVNND
jgi:FkbM family methyltransferase